MFEIKPTKSYNYTNDNLFDKNGIYPVVTNSSNNNGVTGYTNLLPTEKGNMITYSDTTTSDGIFYQPNDFVGYSHIQGLYPKIQGSKWRYSSLIYVVTALRKAAAGRYNYGNKFNRENARKLIVQLPTKEGEIDFEFMESFVAELEAQRVAELEAYLTVTGLKNYQLTKEEKLALKELDTIEWKEYNLEKLFGKATRGKRLKSADRVNGNLIFVTAGETDEGVSAYIGNDVEIFHKNTITIDMFGSAKYRNYNYGADDHIAVVHTEDINNKAAIFITTSIHKVSYNGQFDYGRNFYAKDADKLNIQLPIKNGEINFKYMEILISAIQKLVIKDVVVYAEKKIKATKEVINR